MSSTQRRLAVEGGVAVSDLDAFEERLKTIETLLQGDFTVGQLTNVNYNPVEFANMHGYRIEWLKKLKGPVDSQPASKYVVPDALKSIGEMIRHAMRFADEMSPLLQKDEDGEATVTAQALVTHLVELAGLKLEVK
jgi:hypothetical protein